MFIKNQFLQNRLVLHLLEKENAELLTYSENKQEYLLIKTEKRETTIIRVSLQQFDWKREVLRSIKELESVIEKNIQLPPFQKKVHIHHVFIVDYPPVDDWSEINNQARFIYFFTDERFRSEWNNFSSNIALKHDMDYTYPEHLLELEYQTEQYRRRINQIHHKKINEIKNIFQYGNAFFSYLLIAINIFVFIMLEIAGGSTNPEVLIRFGAKYNAAIVEGEGWRIISSMFLHIGFLHILLNMLAVYYVGIPVEKMYGSIRFLIIYFGAGIAGGTASFAFTPGIAAGASGAIFGLFGALLFFGMKHPKIFLKTIGPNVIFIVLINVVLGFTVPMIDNSAHIGGLIGGFLAAASVSLPNHKAFFQQLAGILIYIIYLIFILSLSGY